MAGHRCADRDCGRGVMGLPSLGWAWGRAAGPTGPGVVAISAETLRQGGALTGIAARA
jgi:hypothetical protein